MLVAVPVMLLGAVAPYAVRLSVRTVEEAGRVAGRLYAISTLGSLVGDLPQRAGCSIPLVGTRRTFLAFALALALVAVPGSAAALRPGPVGVALLLAIPVGTVKATGDARVIWDRETEYQYARVTERPNGERRLELNEGQAVHSVYRPGEWLTDDYWDEMLVLPFADRAARAALGGDPRQRRGHDRARLRPLLPGDARRRRRDRPGADRRRAPALRPARARTCTCTPPTRGRSCAAPTRRCDVIVVDAYRQPYIPFYLSTARVLRRGRATTSTPGGMVVINVGHPERLRPSREGAERDDGRASSGTVLRDPVERHQHACSLGTDAPASARRARRGAARAAAPTCSAVADAAAARLAPALRGGAVYTDDRAPVEWLIDASIVHVAAEGRPLTASS